MLSEVKELVVHFVVTYDDEASIAAAKSVAYGEGHSASVAFWGRLGEVTS